MKEEFIRSYGMTLRSLSKLQKAVLTQSLDQYRISDFNDIKSRIRNYKKCILEIGFGSGEFLLNYSSKNPDVLCIGSEVYYKGIANLINQANNLGLGNICIYQGDARALLLEAAELFFDQIYIICPDPWPKTRHHKRRIIQHKFLDLVLNKCKGTITIATDFVDYARWIYHHLKELNLLFGEFESYRLDESNMPHNWTITKYQQLALDKGGDIYLFNFRRNSSNWDLV